MLKCLSLLCIVLLVTGCKKAFSPSGALLDNSKYLVIDGSISTGNDSTFIKLSRTKTFEQHIVIDREMGAQVTVESDASTSYPLREISAGTYSAAPLNLSNSHKYRLRVKTASGEEYLSDFVVVKNSPPIDSVGFTAKSNGVQIYVNTHDDKNNTRYYRWDYTEAWQFHTTYHSFFERSVPRMNDVYYCFAKDTSGYIILFSSAGLSKDIIYQAPVTSILPTAEKIEMRYSIEIKQYALTPDAYNFWNNLHKNNETNGSIFDAQPTDNQTNYHCLSQPGKLIVGYLSAGTVAKKRVYINREQLPASYNPSYGFGCTIDTVFYGGYDLLNNTANYTAITGLYYSPFLPFGVPNAVTYSSRGCADCTARGVTQTPSFWKP